MHIICVNGKNIFLSLFEGNNNKSTYLSWYNDPENKFWLGISDSIFDFDDLTRFNENKNNNEIRFNIVKKEEDAVIGVCAILLDYHRINAEIEILIGDKNCRGKGLGTEVVSLIVQYCFEELRLHRLEANILVENTRALSCFYKLGFEKCGMRKESIYSKGEYHDVEIVELINKTCNEG